MRNFRDRLSWLRPSQREKALLVLAFLGKHGPSRFTEIQCETGLNPRDLAYILDEFVKRGELVRVESEDREARYRLANPVDEALLVRAELTSSIWDLMVRVAMTFIALIIGFFSTGRQLGIPEALLNYSLGMVGGILITLFTLYMYVLKRV